MNSNWTDLSIKWVQVRKTCRSIGISFCILKGRGGSGCKKTTTLAYTSFEPVMESPLFTESQNLSLWRKYDASKFGSISQSHTKYRGIKWPKTAILGPYFQRYLSLSVQTCPKVRFYHFLHVSVSFVCRNDEILKI